MPKKINGAIKRREFMYRDIEDGKDEFADFWDTEHTHIELKEEEFLEALEKTIWTVESHDTTTIRATVGQYLACKWISENTEVKVLFIGDGSDELCGGYIYFHKAPSSEAFHAENIKLLKDIHKYDGKRADRGVSSCGLEARVPVLDHLFVQAYMAIDPKLRMVTDGVEKWLLRQSFASENILPKEVLFRRKEAFSDGVSGTERSWHNVIQDMVEEKYTDEEFMELTGKLEHCVPVSKESLYFRELFHSYYPEKDMGKVIDYHWLPNQDWVGKITEPSARALDVYK